MSTPEETIEETVTLTPLEKALELIDECTLADFLGCWYEDGDEYESDENEDEDEYTDKEEEEAREKLTLELLDGIIKVESCESWGGGEGERFNYEIFYLPKFKEYLCVQGWYESNMGTEYDTLHVVKPTPITKTSWGVCESDLFDLETALNKKSK